MLVGAPLRGRVLVIDDVITAGTAVREVINIINNAGAELAGVVIGLDRQERGAADCSAVQEVEQAHGVPVLSMVNMGNIIEYLEAADDAPPGALDAMRHYREQYGV
jgi:orotate phosphoribosyltransferase